MSVENAMTEFFDKSLVERRSLEQALSDLRARYQRRPRPELAEKIRNLETEISHREVARNASQRDRNDRAASNLKRQC